MFMVAGGGGGREGVGEGLVGCGEKEMVSFDKRGMGPKSSGG